MEPGNPVFDEDDVQRMVGEGLQALTAMQLSDGGWGWFSGFGERSWPHTTAVVVHGLQIAKKSDVAIVPGVIERGVEWLKTYQVRQVQLNKNAADKQANKEWKEPADNLDAFVYMVLADDDAWRMPRCSNSCIATARSSRSMPRPCMDWLCSSRSSRKSWR